MLKYASRITSHRSAGIVTPARRTAAANSSSCSGVIGSSPVEILGAQVDRHAVRGAVGGAVPGVAVARQIGRVGDALLRDQPFERGQPVLVIGVAGVGV